MTGIIAPDDLFCPSVPGCNSLAKTLPTDECILLGLTELFAPEKVTAIVGWLNQPDSPVVRRNREQILDTFPLLLPALASRSLTPVFSRLTTAIDSGQRLIEAIASLMGVKKKTVRFLRGKKPSLVGSYWLDDPTQLFSAIDAIPENRRPMNAKEWALMLAFWLGSLDATVLSRHASNFRGALGRHLFVGFCTAGYGSAESTLRQYLHRAGSWAPFSAFVRNVGRWCERRAHELDFNDTLPQIASEQIALELLTRFSSIKLLELSEHWQQSIARNRAHTAKIVHWPPLLPGPVFCDGLMVVSLTDSFQLFKESEQLNHCVPMYISACLRGHSHILAIRDESGESLSTVEVVLVEDRFDELTPIIVQHRGVNNSEPDISCTRALSSAIHRLLAPDMQTWFRKIAVIHAERQKEINDDLEHGDDDLSMDAIAEVLPHLELVDDWLTPTAVIGVTSAAARVIDRHYGATDDRRNGASLKS